MSAVVGMAKLLSSLMHVLVPVRLSMGMLSYACSCASEVVYRDGIVFGWCFFYYIIMFLWSLALGCVLNIVSVFYNVVIGMAFRC